MSPRPLLTEDRLFTSIGMIVTYIPWLSTVMIVAYIPRVTYSGTVITRKSETKGFSIC